MDHDADLAERAGRFTRDCWDELNQLRATVAGIHETIRHGHTDRGRLDTIEALLTTISPRHRPWTEP